MAEVPIVVREVVGHSRASVTLDVYSHVLLDEPPDVLRRRRELVERRGGGAPVMLESASQDDESPADAGLSLGMEDIGIEVRTPLTERNPCKSITSGMQVMQGVTVW